MKTKIKDYLIQHKQVIRLKTDLLTLCEHEEGFEPGMLCHLTGLQAYEDFFQLFLDLKPFKEVNVPLEKLYNGTKWSEDFDSPYKEDTKLSLFVMGDEFFEDHFEIVDQSKTLSEYSELGAEEVYKAIFNGELSKEKFIEYWEFLVKM